MPRKAWYVLDNAAPTTASPEKEISSQTASNHHTYPTPPRRGTPLDVYRRQQQELNRLSFASSTGSFTEERRTKFLGRSRTVPSKRARFGSHDPLQVVQLSNGPMSAGTSPKMTGQN